MKTPIDTLLDTIEFKPVDINGEIDRTIPYVTHCGTLSIGGNELDVIVLNDGRRIITEDSLCKFFGVNKAALEELQNKIKSTEPL